LFLARIVLNPTFDRASFDLKSDYGGAFILKNVVNNFV